MFVKDFEESSYFFKNPIIIRIWFTKNQTYRRVTIEGCERVDFHQNGKITILSYGVSYSYFIEKIKRFELLKGLNITAPLFEDYMKRNFSFNYNKIW